MALPSLYPLFMLNPFVTITGGDGLIVELMANPDVTLDPDITVTVEDPAITVTVEEDIEIEVE